MALMKFWREFDRLHVSYNSLMIAESIQCFMSPCWRKPKARINGPKSFPNATKLTWVEACEGVTYYVIII
jgi:hypothetical protein